MFCNQCGIDIPDHSRFCSGCGAEQAADTRRTPSAPAPTEGPTEPVLTLRPVFIPYLQVIGHIPIFLFLGLWGGLFFGGFSQVFLQFADLGIPAWFPFVFFGAVFAFVLPVISFKVNKKTYARTVYTFYPHKLDYFEGFFTVEEKTIHLTRITEVHLRKGPFQSKYGLGTILLSTPATSAGHGRASAGIRLHDVENPDEVYKQVKQLVEQEQQRSRMAA